MTYLASISAWLAPYGPVAWGGVGIGALLLFALTYLIYGHARAHAALAYFAEAQAKTATVNALAPTHTHERITLADFFHPFYEPVQGVRFDHCELFGPANIAIESCALLENIGFIDCEVVIVRTDIPVKGATMFRHCTFSRCTFYRATLLMNQAMFNGLPEDMRRRVNVINAGQSALRSGARPNQSGGPEGPGT